MTRSSRNLSQSHVLLGLVSSALQMGFRIIFSRETHLFVIYEIFADNKGTMHNKTKRPYVVAFGMCFNVW